jgi:hypothetical protein
VSHWRSLRQAVGFDAELRAGPAQRSRSGHLAKQVVTVILCASMCASCLLLLCRNLTHLSLANNNITGNLEALSWTQSRLLRSLNMSGNQLTGALPVSWADLRGPVSIDLSRNRLSGTLPSVWGATGTDGQTMALSLLDLTGNSITGWLSSSQSHNLWNRPGEHRGCLSASRCKLPESLITHSQPLVIL